MEGLICVWKSNERKKDQVTGAIEAYRDCGTSEEDIVERVIKKFSERKHQFKNTEEGVKVMSESIQASIDEEREEQDKETKAVAIKNVMDAFGITIEKAMDSLKIPPAQRSVYVGMIKK